MYFSFFSTATLIASVILFHGLGTTGGVNTFTLFCGFYTISMGVYLINLSRSVSDADASRRYSSAAARHSLLQDTRISLTSDSGGHGHHAQPDARRSATLYRAGGLTTGGVEPLFDYEDSPVDAGHAHGGKFEDRDQGRRRGETAVQMEHFALANDHDGSDSEGEGEGARGGGYRR
ncbi:hypothetical protein JCM9279_001299 [Rhodotorula babjevae]